MEVDETAWAALVEVLREQNGDLREQIDFLRDELRRKDTIIMAMTQRIPELEPAQERPEAPEPPPESRPATGDAQEGIERVSWWRRVTGWRRSP